MSIPHTAISKQYNQQQTLERVEVTFVIDTTGSMASLIEGAKRKIWSIANTIVDINPNADIRMALVAYRDYGDDYVVKTFDMSSDIQGLYSDLLSFRANGGGDNPEAVNEALEASIDDINWSRNRNSKQIMFLVGDAPPHMDYANGPKYPEVIRKARRKGITIHAVQAGNSRITRNIWQDIAQRGGGNYIPIPQDGGRISQIETPYDQQILRLQQRLDDTVIPYGNKKKRAKLIFKMKEKAAAPKASQVENSKFYSKRASRKEVITGGGDIISAIQNKDIALGDVKTEELPTELKVLDAKARDKFIKNKITEREKLEAEMSELAKKHDEYVATEGKKVAKSDSFDAAVSQALSSSF